MAAIRVTGSWLVYVKLYKSFSHFVAVTLMAQPVLLVVGHGNLFYGG
jgi:hypothetical protein